jgi:C-terminal processing protease CtpA/Prc
MLKSHSVFCAVFVPLAVFFGRLSVTNAGHREEVEQARSKLSVDRRCVVGEEMEFVIPPGRAARLDCRNLGIGLTEVLFYQIDQRLYRRCVWADGHFSGGGQRRPIHSGQTTWVPKPPIIAFFLKWETQADEISITVRTETDRDIISNVMKTPDLTADERVAGFVRLWSEVKYNFAFFDQVPHLHWDAALEEYLPKVQQAQSTEEYYRLLKRCIALLQDGHTRIDGPTNEPDSRPPLHVRAVDGKAVIVEVHPADDILDPGLKARLLKANLKLGEKITHVDGRGVKEILEHDVYPYICASTAQSRDLQAYPKLLQGEYSTQAKLRIKSLDGGEREVTLTRGYYRSQRRREGFAFRQLDDGLAYVNLDSFGSEEVVEKFDEVFDRVAQSIGLIIDVRENGGGSTSIGYAIISYLTDKTLEGSRWKTRQYMPAFRAWGRPEKWHEGQHDPIVPRKEGFFLGPVVVLIGPSTCSAAEDFVVALHASGRATLVGQKTRGSTGQPLRIDLPGGGRAGICTKRDTYPDGREFVGIGIIPDIEAHPTPADVAADHDVVLEEGLKVLKSRLK